MRFSVLLLGMLLSVLALSQNIPPTELASLEGEKINTSDYLKEGRVTIIDFWATWCGPCIMELNAMRTIYPDWKEKYGVTFLAISLDNSRALPKAKLMAEQNKWPYDMAYDGQQSMRNLLQFNTIPQIYIVNGQGEVLKSITGYKPGMEKEIEEVIKKHTTEKS